jgi:hypothetical protein
MPGSAKMFERGVKLAPNAAGHFVDDEDVGFEGFYTRAQGSGAQRDNVIEVDVETARLVMAVAGFAEGREGEVVDTWMGLERGGFSSPGYYEYGGIERGSGECLGNEEVAAHVTEAHRVVGVEGNAQR